MSAGVKTAPPHIRLTLYSPLKKNSEAKLADLSSIDRNKFEIVTVGNISRLFVVRWVLDDHMTRDSETISLLKKKNLPTKEKCSLNMGT